MKNKFSIAMSLAVMVAMLVTSLAFADTVTPDADIITGGDQSSQDLGTVAPGAILTPKASFKLVCTGKQHVDEGQTVNLTFNLAGSTIPAGRLSATTASIGSIPATWPDDTTGAGSTNCPSTPPVLGDNGDSTVTITAPMAAGTYTYVVRYNFGFSPSEGSGDANDIVGSNTTVTYSLTVLSNTAPSVSVTGVTDGASYEFGSVPAAGCSVTDAEDGNSSPAATLSLIAGPLAAYGLGSQTASCAYTDGGGLSDSDSATYSIVDTTAPTIDSHGDVTAEATSPSGAVVNYTSPATHDAVFGDDVATCSPASSSLFPLGDTTVKCDATDGAGNAAAQTSFVVHVVDTTAPIISCTVPDQAIWYGADVTVNCTASDSASGLADAADASFSLSTSVSAGTETSGASTGSKTVSDNAGNSAVAGPYTFKVDKKAPSVSCGSADGSWHASDVSIACTASDAGSGLADLADASFSLVTNVPTGTEDANASTNSRAVADAVGNSATAGPISGNMIDKKAPTSISFVGGGIADGGIYYFGFVPAGPTGCTAVDAGSGLASCSVTGYSTAVGSHTLTATALDNVGNSDTSTMSYTVNAWTLNGFFQPVDMNGVYNIVKNGSTVPLKFEIFAGSTELNLTSYVKSLTYAQTSCDATATTDDIETTATGGTSLRYDSVAGQFVYNWKTPATAGKCYRVTMETQDGSKLVAYFKLK